MNQQAKPSQAIGQMDNRQFVECMRPVRVPKALAEFTKVNYGNKWSPPPAEDVPVLRGPVTAKWLAAANKCGERDSLALGCLLWMQAETKDNPTVAISVELAGEFGVSRNRIGPILDQLEAARLIEIVSKDLKLVVVLPDGPVEDKDDEQEEEYVLIGGESEPQAEEASPSEGGDNPQG